MEKTNVMRLLDIAGISYIEREYDESIVNGIQVAEALKEDVDCVFKTLVVENQKKFRFLRSSRQRIRFKKSGEIRFGEIH